MRKPLVLIICGLAGILLIVVLLTRHTNPVAVRFLCYTNTPAGGAVAVFELSNRCPESIAVYVSEADGFRGILQPCKHSYSTFEVEVVAPTNGMPWRLPVQYCDYRGLPLRSRVGPLLRGVLVTPDGVPVAGGTVAVGSGQSGGILGLKNALLVDRGGQGKVVTTDAAGEFVLPSPPETATVIAAEQRGFGFASVRQVRDSGRLTLQPFGRIEGTFKRAGLPVTDQEFTLSMRDLNLLFDRAEYKGAADENGRFAFDRVPPGEIRIVRPVSTAPNFWTDSFAADVTVLPGQTAQVVLGDSGGTLAGRIRFESPPAEAEKLRMEGLLFTVLPGGMSAEEARAYIQPKTFVVSIADDGSWNVDSIPPGTYKISVTASKPGAHPWENSPVAIGTAEVVVPEGATPQTQVAVEEIVLRPVGQRAGQAVPRP
jgi:hypothetical protein